MTTTLEASMILSPILNLVYCKSKSGGKSRREYTGPGNSEVENGEEPLDFSKEPVSLAVEFNSDALIGKVVLGLRVNH